MKKVSLALKLLRRNAHAGEAQVLIAALLIAVASVTTVSFFADRVESALNRQANELIAADAIVRSDKGIDVRFFEEANRQGLLQSRAWSPGMLHEGRALILRRSRRYRVCFR